MPAASRLVQQGVEMVDALLTRRRVPPSIIDARAGIPLHGLSRIDRRIHQGNVNATIFAPIDPPVAMTTNCFPPLVR